MSTTTQAKYKDIQVEIQDIFECGGVKLVVVKAAENEKPFVDGAKTTTKTAYKTVECNDLEECSCSHLDRDFMSCGFCRKETQRRYGDDIPF